LFLCYLKTVKVSTLHISSTNRTTHEQCFVADVEGKAVPFTGPRDPEGSRKLRFPDYVTKAQDGGKVVSLTHRPFLPTGNTCGTHFC